MSNIK